MTDDANTIVSTCGRTVGPEGIRHAQEVVHSCAGLSRHGQAQMILRQLRDHLWRDGYKRCSAKTTPAKTASTRSAYVYILEAYLAFPNGLTLPLMGEFLNCAEGDTSNSKQDCDTRAFHRMARRLKAVFPRLPIMLLLDGLCPNGPILKTCRDKGWQFMIVLQDASLPSVREEYEGLRKLEPE